MTENGSTKLMFIKCYTKKTVIKILASVYII